MEFPRQVYENTILRLPELRPETQTIEFRQDPLTGARCRLNRKRVERPKQVSPGSAVDGLARKPDNCPFCPENIGAATPRFPAAICRDGFYEVGECRLFPNLFPLAPFHANITLSRRHFVSIEQFSAAMLEDALETARLFFRDVFRAPRSDTPCGCRNSGGQPGTTGADPVATAWGRGKLYPLVCWNHLPPSGGSIVHPHMQALLDRGPSGYQARLLEASAAYFEKTGSNYWTDLPRVEREKGERFVGENSSVWVLASYAPQGNREFQIIFTDGAGLLDLAGDARKDLVDALLRLLRYYHDSGVDSFNFTTLSAALGERQDFYNLNGKLIARPAVQPLYRNDTGVLERVHYEADVEMAPETIAREARGYFP
ncbi:MAG: hypothetical protein HY673_14035 [Chloroflexi bacterium]|nr:hypothetical protein [Chloroflexota bacterium]